jgi:thioredoxin 1
MPLTEVTTETFPSEVLSADRPVLVDFWGPKCAPCIALMPAVEALAAEHAVRLKVVKVNANARENWPLSREHSVLGLPAYLFFHGGQEVKRLSGNNVTRQSLAEAIEAMLNTMKED